MVPQPQCNDAHTAAATLLSQGPIMESEYLNCLLFAFGRFLHISYLNKFLLLGEPAVSE